MRFRYYFITTTRKNKMNINHISVSRISTWQECTAKYRYHYHLKIPSPVEEPFYFTYGKLIHKISECYVSSKGDRTIGEITQDVLNGKISLERNDKGEVKCPTLPAEYKKKLPDHLAAIYRLTKQIGFDGEVEKLFEYDLDPPHKRTVKGFIDRVIKKEGNFFLLDYKTSKKNFYRKNSSNISKDLQLRTYARVIQREYNVPAKSIKAALYYLEQPELIGCIFSEESLANVEKELLEIYKQIESMPEDKAWGNVGDWCKRCNYVKQCPFYRLT